LRALICFSEIVPPAPVKPILSTFLICLAAGTALAAADIRYNRAFFGRWPDRDRDCLNTRQEMLEAQSLQPTQKSASGCRVLRGQPPVPRARVFFNESGNLIVTQGRLNAQ
jgi:hypothetical protein